MNAFAVMKKLLVVYTGHSSSPVPVMLAQQRSWPEQTADMKSAGLQLEMQAYTCETLLCINPFVQWCRLSRCVARCCMRANMYAECALVQCCCESMTNGTGILECPVQN